MESCYARLCVAQLHSSAVVFDTQAQGYQLVHARFRHARVLGVCMSAVRTPQQVQFQIDDGTGVLAVRVDRDAVIPDSQVFTPGAMVDCMGRIDEPWPPSASTCGRRWLQATHINSVQDLNLETLRMLEILHLYEHDYAAPHGSSSNSSSLQLLALPSLSSTVREAESPLTGVKRKTPPVQQRPGAHPVEHPRPQTVIERPRVQPARGALALDSAVPPGEYHFTVSPGDLQLIECGAKTLEIRLNVTPYSIIHVNDRITINDRMPTTVTAVRKYSKLASVLETEKLDALLPRGTQTGTAATSTSAAAALRHFRQFFSADEEEQHGLVVFQLAVAGGQAKSDENWSKLLYSRLEQKHEAGCSVQDLQFAFPALPVTEIQEILTAMQLDGVVYALQGKYHLL